MNIKNIINNHQFWQEVEQLELILAPIKRAVTAVKTKSSNTVLSFLELVKLANAIKSFSIYINSNFQKQYIRIC